jgi:hypothetical protein
MRFSRTASFRYDRTGEPSHDQATNQKLGDCHCDPGGRDHRHYYDSMAQLGRPDYAPIVIRLDRFEELQEEFAKHPTWVKYNKERGISLNTETPPV